MAWPAALHCSGHFRYFCPVCHKGTQYLYVSYVLESNIASHVTPVIYLFFNTSFVCGDEEETASILLRG